MKKSLIFLGIISLVSICASALVRTGLREYFFAGNRAFLFSSFFTEGYKKDIILDGAWINTAERPAHDTSDNKTGKKLTRIYQNIYFIHSSGIDTGKRRSSRGGVLNLQYFSGISYEYLRKQLPGKTINLEVYIPAVSISPNAVIPNRLRASLKAETDGKWVEYYGQKEWITVKNPGVYNIEINVPEKPVKLSAGLFNPSDIKLFCVDYWLMEGSKHNDNVSLCISNFEIEDIDIKPDKIQWQSSCDGYADKHDFLPCFSPESTFITGMGKEMNLTFKLSRENALHCEKTGIYFLDFACHIPKELKNSDMNITISTRDDNNTLRSYSRDLGSCTTEGKLFIPVPLYPNLSNELRLNITSSIEHTSSMMPIILDPIKRKQGQLVSFSEDWKIRDVQEQGGYSDWRFPANLKGLPYQMTSTFRLRGGIDWHNPHYKVELVKALNRAPVNMQDMKMELIISPLTDTTEKWQRPYRARIGLLDTDGNVMFGPNISLSEGVTQFAELEVSTDNPIPKGLVFPKFDPKKVKSLVINLEASHANAPVKDLDISFINFVLRPQELFEQKRINDIDFSRFEIRPESWEFTKMIRSQGGYGIGMNFPFPDVDVPKDILEVPLVYPCVGKKPNDLVHLGFSSKITGQATYETFKKLAETNIGIIRLLILGHLEGIFTWDENGKYILGFLDNDRELALRLSKMPIEELVNYLNMNEEILFNNTHSGKFGYRQIPGLEEHVLADFIALLDIMERVENQTDKRLLLIASLYDFTVADGITKEGPLKRFPVGEHIEVIIDPVTRMKAHCILWKLMKTLREDARFHRYIGIAEIMNEPFNACAVVNRRHFAEMVNFVGEGLYVLKDTLGPDIPVSVGFRSWPYDLAFWSNIRDGVDVLMPHYWESLESYNIDTPGLWPLDMKADLFWQYFRSRKNGRMTGIGEISPGGDLRNNLNRIARSGFDFALIWSYSGHDGHDAKPIMNILAEYTRFNNKYAYGHGSRLTSHN